ncbi:hypothetical protein ABV409_11135 [Flagellimonas sp. DF-77]|uniref:Ig-like domain-containing protein n=1 Tax=Flagellimonas algarum TaxID=3230298 RepID=UPI00339B5916
MIVSQTEAYSQSEPTLLVPDDIHGTVQLDISAFVNTGTEKPSYNHLAVFVSDENEKYGAIPVQGRHTVEGDYLVFTPFFPFERGLAYVVRFKQFDTEIGHSYRSFFFEGQQPSHEVKVLGIYPSGNVLPENLLRFYIHFNTPMKKGMAMDYITLSDAAGTSVPNSFMEFKQELWSPDGKRLTLLFDPGRIKRGVSTHMQLGPALLEGDRFYLTVSEAWQNVFGATLSKKTTKEFLVGVANRTAIDLRNWQIHRPKVRSLEPLTIIFDRAMDHALLQSMITIEGEVKKSIAGQWEVHGLEHRIQFVPSEEWQQGSYRIIVDSRLEDVAGNNLQNPLDQIKRERGSDSPTHQTIEFQLGLEH